MDLESTLSFVPRSGSVLKTLSVKRNQLALMAIAFAAISCAGYLGALPSLPGFLFILLVPGYLVSSAIFKTVPLRLSFSPAISLILLVLPSLALNTLLKVPIARELSSLILLGALAFSLYAWYRHSRKAEPMRLPRRFYYLLLLAIVGISVPAAINGTFGADGVIYGGNYDNDPWMHQAYANRLLIDGSVPVRDPFISVVDKPRFYHYGLHVFMAMSSLLTGARAFQALQAISFLLPVWFTLTAFVFLIRFLKERTALLVLFLFLFGGGIGGFLMAGYSLNLAAQQGTYNVPSLLLSRDDPLMCPWDVCSLDILYKNNLPFSLLIIPQPSGLLLAFAVFPMLLLALGDLTRSRRLLLGALLALSIVVQLPIAMLVSLSLGLFFLIRLLTSPERREVLAGAIDVYVVAALLAAPYYAVTYLFSDPSAPGLMSLLPFQGNLILPTIMMFGLIFLGFPYIIALMWKRRDLSTVLLFSVMVVTFVFIARLSPVTGFAIRNYAIRLSFIPVAAGFGMLLERWKAGGIKLALVLLIVSSSAIINSSAYYYVALTGKDSIHYPEWESLEWIRANVPEDSVFLSSEYGLAPFSKISAFTGRFIVFGGPSMWFYDDETIGSFKEEIDGIYSGNESLRDAIERYGIDYVYVGPSEREKYGEGVLESSGLDTAFSNSGAEILISARARAGG